MRVAMRDARNGAAWWTACADDAPQRNEESPQECSAPTMTLRVVP
jgi:hypothetical protein